MTITLANRITLIRILNIPLYVVLLVYYKQSMMRGEPVEAFRYCAFAAFSISILLDVIDGWLARRRGETSQLGAILDPVADKALLISSYLLLSANSHSWLGSPIPAWLAVLVISRDIVLIAGAMVINLLSGKLKVLPRFLGKLTTFLQTVVVVLSLLHVPSPYFTPFLVATAVATVASAAQYFYDGYRQLERI